MMPKQSIRSGDVPAGAAVPRGRWLYAELRSIRVARCKLVIESRVLRE